MSTLSALVTPTNVLTATNTQTLTNKTINGSSNTITNVSLTTGVTGTLPVANGGTGNTTIPALSIPVANTLNTFTSVTPAAGQSVRINAGNTAWEAYTPSSGTVSSISVVSANGLAGTVATATTTPAITLSTTITGVLKGNGTAISAATAGTDYVAPGTATTFTAAQNFAASGITLKGSSTGITTFASANASVTNYTVTFPAATGTVLTTAAAVQAIEGGTGQTSYAVGDLLYASTTTALSKLADVATGNSLISGGVGVAPSWGKIGLTTHVSGTLAVANGGTNLTTYTANGVLYASGTTTLANGSVLTFNGSTLGVNGVSIGRGASAVATNTAVGTTTLNANTTGDLNTAVGYQALATNTTGVSNTAVGYNALNLNSLGNWNTAVGRHALINTTSDSNTGLGYRALDTNTTGAQNTATGDRALFSNLTGSNNAAYGYFALNASTGGSNAAFGTNAGSGITTGSNNTIIGSYTGGGAPISATGSNFIVLSDGAGNVRLYSDASGNINVPSLTASKAVFTDASKSLTTTGTLGVAQGGTGATTLTGVLKGNGTSAFTAATAGTDYVTPTGTETLTNKTLTNPVFTGYTETVYSTYTTALNPANGTVQRFALTANTTFTDSLASGQSITLMIDDGTAYTITWPTITWVGGSAPTLATTGYTVVEIWKVSTTLYGALIGTVA